MKDLKKQAQILLKRNGFWIILAFAISLLFSGISQTKTLESNHSSFISIINNMELMGKTGKEYNNNTIIDKEFIKESDKLFDKLSKEYKYEEYENFDYENASESEQRKYNEQNLENGEYLSTLSQYEFMRDNLEPENSNYMTDTIIVMGLIVVISLAVLFTSMEHSTSYYEFSSMYPWSRKKDFAMKFIIGVVIIGAFVILSSLLNYMIIKTSNFEILKIGLGHLKDIGKSLIFLSSIYLVMLSTGFMSGNILGHIGLTFLSFFFINIVDMIRSNLISIFSGSIAYDKGITQLIYDLFPIHNSNINVLIRSILMPISEYSMSIYAIAGTVIFSLICFGISFALVEKIKTEKSGIMVLIKPFENLAKVLIILLMSSFGTLLFQTSIFEGFSIINLVIFAILTFVFTKIFNILFKIKLKV